MSKKREYRIDSLDYLYADNDMSWLRRHVLHARTKRIPRRAGRACRSRGARLAGQNVDHLPQAPGIRHNRRPGTVTVSSTKTAEDLHKYYRVPRRNIRISE